MTPTFTALHTAHFTVQCDTCAANGWPPYTFTCAAEDITCCNY